MTPVWYHVRDLEAARAFYTSKLGFAVNGFDVDGGWATLERNGTEIGLATGEPQEDGPVAHVDVEDVKTLADELRDAGVDVGVVVELHGEMRVVDVFDPEGNRLEFAQDMKQ